MVFPELTLSGLPARGPAAEDELPRRGAARRCASWRRRRSGIVAVVGYPERAEDVYNAAAVLADGEVVATYRKMYLPNYGVFDEQRYFQSGAEAAIVELNGVPIGLSICEDIWEPGPPAMTRGARRRAGDRQPVGVPLPRAATARERERMLVQRAVDYLAAVVFVNTVGGQDELVFDGHSLAIDQDGAVLARAPQFEEALDALHDRPARGRGRAPARHAPPRQRPPPAPRRSRSRSRRVFTLASVNVDSGGRAWWPASGAVARAARRRSTRRCAPGCATTSTKNGFEHVVLGLSGGIDSALAALVAVDALGPERVTCVSMPSPYSSEGTRADARAIAENLGVDFREIADRGGDGRLRGRCSATSFEGREPGRRRGEPPGAHPRQRGDGALEQVRLARARPPATSPRCRSATPRSTATWRAASRC